MALMRGNPYVYINNEDQYVIHAYAAGGSVELEPEAMQELAVMVVAGLDTEQLAAAVRRVVELHGGNFGASAVMEGLGLPTAYDMVRDALAEIRKET